MSLNATEYEKMFDIVSGSTLQLLFIKLQLVTFSVSIREECAHILKNTIKYY